MSVYAPPPASAEYLAQLTARRMAELSSMRSRIAALERSANAAAEQELQHRKTRIVSEHSDPSGSCAARPQLESMGVYITELKRFLKNVHDADATGDTTLQLIAAEHCAAFAVQLMDLMADPKEYEAAGSFTVMEMASSTLAMLSTRPGVARALSFVGAPLLAARLLSPLFPTAIVANMAMAAGRMAEDLDARLCFRAHGGVGALVRLLQPDIDPLVQAEAATALSMLAACDSVVQDSTRYLGGIEVLVALLASHDARAAEAARLCLSRLRAGNPRNAAAVVSAIRASAELAVASPPRTRIVSELLSQQDGDVNSAFSAAALRVRSLIGGLHGVHASASPGPALHAPEPAAVQTTPLPAMPAAPPLSQHAGSVSARLRTSAAAMRAAAAAGGKLPTGSPRTSLGLGAGNMVMTPVMAGGSGGRGSRMFDTASSAGMSVATNKYGEPPASACSSALRDSVRELNELIDAMAVDDIRLSASSLGASASYMDAESELLHKRHLACYGPEDVCILLEEMGLNRAELRRFRIARIDGSRLLKMTSAELSLDMGLPNSKVKKLLTLRRAVMLFDTIATLPRQGCLAEVELRLWMAVHGATPATVAKVLRLLRSLVRTSAYDFLTFCDFITAYDWIVQAFRIYGLPC